MELKITSMHNKNGPEFPYNFSVVIRDHEKGGQEVIFFLGKLKLRVYPYNQEQIHEFGEKLINLGE